MSFPKYPAYKDSGVEWLGEVPEHWDISPLKREFVVVGGSTPKSDIQDYWDGDIQWITPADLSRLKSFEITESIRSITAKGLNSCGTTMVPSGSIVISTRAPIGSLGTAAIDLCTNQGCKALVPINQIGSSFTTYFLSIATEALNVRGRGTTFLEISGDELGSFKATFPPSQEQIQIADFLDYETAKIDALIAEQQRLIELLQEKRQTVISHAVTKGLNPDVPMKDSGVEWLGEVPEHWRCLPLKRYVFSSNAGEVIDKSYWGGDDELLYTCAIDPLRCDYKEFPDWKRTTESDLLLTRNGTPYVHRPIPGSIYTNVVQRVSLLSGRQRDYLAIAIQNSANNLKGYGVSIESLNYQMWSALPVPLPPFEEQQAILDALSIQTKRFDSLLTEAGNAVQLLGERRSALISAAVTGQIDVRGLVPEAVAV